MRMAVAAATAVRKRFLLAALSGCPGISLAVSFSCSVLTVWVMLMRVTGALLVSCLGRSVKYGSLDPGVRTGCPSFDSWQL